MRIIVSVIGRFHAFNLSKSFQDNYVLESLFTSLPKIKASHFGIDKQLTKSCWWCEVFVRLLRNLKILEKYPKFIYLYHFCYMRSLSKFVRKRDANIFIGFAGVSLEAIRIAKSKGMITILERGSSHRAFQKRILENEYRLTNIVSVDDFTNREKVFQREIQEYEEADFISIPSNFVKRTFIEQGIDEHKLIVNAYGVSLKEMHQVERTDKKFRIIFAGSGCLRKGYHYLLQAVSELNFDDLEVWHLGTLRPEMKKYMNKYQSKNWILKGHIKQTELYKYYSQGSVFILPSIEEGFAMVQFQAMACGLPLICTTNTGGEDLISKNGEEGFVIPIRDVEALKDKITVLYKNPDICKEMGVKAKKRIQSGFTWDDYGKRYIDNLKSIINR